MTETAATVAEAQVGQETKDLYEVGEIPPLGHVPERMYAWTIRRERHGEPETAMQVEVVFTHLVFEGDLMGPSRLQVSHFVGKGDTGNRPVELEG